MWTWTRSGLPVESFSLPDRSAFRRTVTDRMLLGDLLAVAGLIVGSFLSTVITHVPDGRSVIRPGPACPSCESAI